MSALPSISAREVRDAIERVALDGVPPGRGSTKFCLADGGRHYPPKYVVALASRSALGRDLRPDEFSGGPQTNRLLEGLGFEVVSCPCGGIRGSSSPVAPPVVAATQGIHQIKVARIVCKGQPPRNARAQERLLLEVFGPRWPTGLCTKFVITPGGFVHGDWPSSWDGRSGWESGGSDIAPLFIDAERQLARVVTDRVLRAASGKTDVLTIGIDLEGAVEHAELVAVFDIAKRRIARWTGKSYPTGSQEHTLVHVSDLDSHLLEVAGERVLILGCHDLNMYSPRGRATQSSNGPRRAVCDAMKQRVARFRPTIVLQHPHSTDTPNIWRMPWLALAREVPSVRTWASGIAYYRWGGVRAELERVLDLTRSAGDEVHDIIVGVGARSSR